MNILPRIKFCGILIVLCFEIRHCAKRQTVRCKRRTTHNQQETDRQKNEILTLKPTRNKVTDGRKN